MKRDPVRIGGSPIDEKLQKLHRELVQTPLHALEEPASGGETPTVVWALVRAAYGLGYQDSLIAETREAAVAEARRLGIPLPGEPDPGELTTLL